MVVAALGFTLASPLAFAQSAAPARPLTAPTCAEPEFGQFDFWVGEWIVFDTLGQEVGRNTVERVLGGCVLTESWIGASGSRGRSLNIYDRFAKRWHQSWVDDQGLLLQLDGGLHEGSMVLQGDRQRPDGGRARHRIAFAPLPDGSVRQHWQRSLDEGRSWTTAFLGIYRRTAPRQTPQ